MLNSSDFILLMEDLNKRLKNQGISGHLIIAGGAVMSFVFETREFTSDVDALFNPPNVIRAISAQMSEDYSLEGDWLNDGVKGFVDLRTMGTVEVKCYSNLLVERLDDESLLALKLTSARDNDGKDLEDSIVLINKLGLKSVEEALDIVEQKIPQQQIPVKTQFFTEIAVQEALRRRISNQVDPLNEASLTYTYSVRSERLLIEDALTGEDKATKLDRGFVLKLVQDNPDKDVAGLIPEELLSAAKPLDELLKEQIKQLDADRVVFSSATLLPVFQEYQAQNSNKLDMRQEMQDAMDMARDMSSGRGMDIGDMSR